MNGDEIFFDSLPDEVKVAIFKLLPQLVTQIMILRNVSLNWRSVVDNLPLSAKNLLLVIMLHPAVQAKAFISNFFINTETCQKIINADPSILSDYELLLFVLITNDINKLKDIQLLEVIERIEKEIYGLTNITPVQKIKFESYFASFRLTAAVVMKNKMILESNRFKHIRV